jgi:hypothetical protein
MTRLQFAIALTVFSLGILMPVPSESQACPVPFSTTISCSGEGGCTGWATISNCTGYGTPAQTCGCNTVQCCGHAVGPALAQCGSICAGCEGEDTTPSQTAASLPTHEAVPMTLEWHEPLMENLASSLETPEPGPDRPNATRDERRAERVGPRETNRRDSAREGAEGASGAPR